ncbi:MAG: hypothetical protein DBY24_09160 [Prevotellaceae bacterium]|nr:MAG: hypothetical protein DBY24_09160 [Prevotellaceae bacterium]
MASQTFSKNWGDGTTDKFYVTWDDSTLPGRASVKVTSDPNYTGEQRSAEAVFTTVGGSSSVKKILTVMQQTDNLVIAYYGDSVVSTYSNNKAGFARV